VTIHRPPNKYQTLLDRTTAIAVSFRAQMTMMKTMFAICIWIGIAVLAAHGQAPPRRPTLEQLEKRAINLLPTKAQLRFQEIPWVHDLVDAQKIAQSERRPMFLWGYGGRARPDIALEGC
jgi:hypothetical protein